MVRLGVGYSTSDAPPREMFFCAEIFSTSARIVDMDGSWQICMSWWNFSIAS
jgi:hypothetical protein